MNDGTLHPGSQNLDDAEIDQAVSTAAVLIRSDKAWTTSGPFQTHLLLIA